MQPDRSQGLPWQDLGQYTIYRGGKLVKSKEDITGRKLVGGVPLVFGKLGGGEDSCGRAWGRRMTQRKDIMDGKDKPILPKRILKIEIRASEDKCLSWWPDPKKRCPHYGTRRFGSVPVCCLFGKDLGEGGHRLKECLEAEDPHE